MSRPMGIGPELVILCCVGFLVLQPPSASAQQSNIDFSVTGTSTIRGWTCTVTGVVEVKPGSGQALPGFASGVQAATLRIPVKAFKCSEEEMYQHLLEAMEAEKFPEITYRLEKYEVKGGQAQATGTMTITDVSAPMTIPVGLKADGQALQIQGNIRLDMTKFGVEPPVVMLGLLKVGPQIRIDFKGVVAP